MMKEKLILTVGVVMISFMTFAQSKSVAMLTQKYKDIEKVVNFQMNGNIGNFNTDGFLNNQQKESLVKSISGFKFLQIPKEDLKSSDILALQKGLEKEKYEMIMEVFEKKNQVKVFSKGDQIIKDLIVTVKDSKDSFIIVELNGNFDPKIVNQIAKNLK